ncbi:hypothetical protein DPMN_056601 [Dreissena polymorpha]|uniref:Uncharacterized protein n=1 Tax=Dreissena polymorpha TaxID=45954 RepID=A0A9D4CUP2_DREPO|nr:hypothetical protein DPMN_056601 [Dreissena polymorpha]
MNARLQSFKEEIQADINGLEGKVKQLSVDSVNFQIPRQNSVVIKGHAYHEGETLNTKVEIFITEGLGLCNVHVLNSERKPSERAELPGVVICSFQTVEEEKKVLSDKYSLKDSRQYTNVFLYKDQSVEERTFNRNLKVIVDTLRDQ